MRMKDWKMYLSDLCVCVWLGFSSLAGKWTRFKQHFVPILFQIIAFLFPPLSFLCGICKLWCTIWREASLKFLQLILVDFLWKQMYSWQYCADFLVRTLDGSLELLWSVWSNMNKRKNIRTNPVSSCFCSCAGVVVCARVCICTVWLWVLCLELEVL